MTPTAQLQYLGPVSLCKGLTNNSIELKASISYHIPINKYD